MTPEEKLKFYITEIENSLTKKDFELAFEEVIKIIRSLQKTNAAEFDGIHTAFETLAAKVKKDTSMDMTDIRKECQKMMAGMMKEHQNTINYVYDKVRKLKDGKPGKNGVSPKISDIVPEVIKAMPEDPEETGDDIIAKINDAETLISKDSVEDLVALEEKVNQIELRPMGRGGAKGIGLYVNGAKKLLTAQTINLIGGTNVTLTYNNSGGRNDITISSTGGSGGGGILAATGLVNGTNAIYTFDSAPSQVIVDGVPKQKTQSDGTVNWTGTTTITLAVAPNFDIYGIS